MRLLLLNSIGRTKWGGGEKWMVMTAKNLMMRGHDVYIGCSSHSILERKSLVERIPVLPIDIKSDFSLLGLVKLKKYYADKAFDVIIGCQNRDVKIAGFLVKKILRSKCLVFSRQGVQLLSNSFKYKWTFLPFCDGIITNTYSIKNIYDSYGWWNDEFVKVIHNGIRIQDDNCDAFDYNTYLPLDKKPFIVLSAGRLAEQKGFRYLLQAAEKVITQQPNTYFFIAGKGKLEHELRVQIAKYGLESNVFLLGFQENVMPLLKGADLFVLPSLYEGMPNALMEAMSAGKPVVSTNVNGVSELLENEECGIIVPPADPEALASGIFKMLKGNGLVEIGKKAQKHIADHFSVEKMVDEIELFLNTSISNRNN